MDKVKVGDYICYEYVSCPGEYCCTQITKIDDNKIWGYFTMDFKEVTKVPMTLEEFNIMKKEDMESYVDLIL